jgi:lipopolysaccharide export system protein LptA
MNRRPGWPGRPSTQSALHVRSRYLPAMALVLTALWAIPARAQGIDLTQGGPIQITARDGIDWRQAEQVVIAKGDAKAVRGNVTVTADRLLAWYRKKGATEATQPVTTGLTGETDTEGNEVYRMRAEGNVHIFTQTDQAWGDQATYDLDQAVMVMTGNHLKLTTPNDTLTARDTLEYWSAQHMAVARGDAVIVTNDARRITADTLVAYTQPGATAATSGSGQSTPGPPVPGPAAPGSTQSASATPGPPAKGSGPAEAMSSGSVASGPPAQSQTATQAANPTGDPMVAMAGRLERVEAFGNVTVRTVTDIVIGDRGVYVPDTGIAHLGGHVRITRGLNQINGAEAVVNMKTGIATLLSGDSGRVSGLVVPNDQSSPPPGDAVGNQPSGNHPKGDQPKRGASQ